MSSSSVCTRIFHAISTRTVTSTPAGYVHATPWVAAQLLGVLIKVLGYQDEQDPTYFELEYVNGTQCDLTGETRSTTVHFICGESDQFVSIKEVRSCHYKVIVSTPRVCRHPAFSKEIPNTVKIKCRSPQEAPAKGKKV
jgi:hypothetical protein